MNQLERIQHKPRNNFDRRCNEFLNKASANLPDDYVMTEMEAWYFAGQPSGKLCHRLGEWKSDINFYFTVGPRKSWWKRQMFSLSVLCGRLEDWFFELYR